MTQKQSVVIIGGGPAGLTAAWEFVNNGGSDTYDVTVLEETQEFGGISRTWQGQVYKKFVAPRLAPPTEREDPRPPTFAQLVGLIILGVGFALGHAGVPNALLISAILAFIAAFLNAVFNFCLGCEIYGIGVRLRNRGSATAA